MKNRSRLMGQIIKFVGGTAFAMDTDHLFLLTELFRIHYLGFKAISFTVSVVYKYILSIK